MHFQENRKKCRYHAYRFYDVSDPTVKFCICGKRQGEKEKGNKFNAKQTQYEGLVYDSQKEADYAAELDLRKRAKDILGWDHQVKVSLDVNGYHITNYYLDFKVYLKNGKTQWVEVKGYETQLWQLKRRLFEAVYLYNHPDEEYLIVK